MSDLSERPLLIAIGIVFGIVIGIAIGGIISEAYYRREAIRYGHAKYDRDTGAFEWNEVAK